MLNKVKDFKLLTEISVSHIKAWEIKFTQRKDRNPDLDPEMIFQCT